MTDAWREWVSENPFLRHDLRRWKRRGYGWKLPLACAGLPALPVLALHGLYAFFPFLQSWFSLPQLGPVLFSLVSLVHVVAAAGFAATTFSLPREAVAGRLEFIRLLPLRSRELMVKLGLARAVLRVLPALVPLPLYLLLMAYGGVPLEDVAALYALFAAMLFAPPGFLEIHSALTVRRGTAVASPAAQGAAARNPVGFFWIIAFQGLFQLVLRTLMIPVFSAVWVRLKMALGPQLGALLPLSAVAAAARMLWQPAPFFGGVAAPFWLLSLYWAARWAARVVGYAELWSREPALQAQGAGRTAAVLPEATGRPNERRTRRALESVSGALLSITVAGYLWRPLVLTGALGDLTGSATPSGGMAALLLLLGGLGFLALFERVRADFRVEPAGLVRESAGLLVLSLERATAFLLLVSLLGGVLPWPEPAAALGLLALAAAGGLVFALGWRRVAGPVLSRPATTSLRTMAVLLLSLLWVATYAGPAAVLAYLPGRALPHLAVAWSPVYALLCLLPGLWRAPSPLPLPVSLALPALAGLLLLALSPRQAAATAEVVVERSGRDPVEAYLRRIADRWQNPLFGLAARRLARRPNGLTGRLLGALGLAIGLPFLLFAAPIIAIVSTRSGGGQTPASVWRALTHPFPVLGLTFGGVMALAAALLLLWFAIYAVGMALPQSVALENRVARQQGRLQYLLISPLEDRQVVLGILAAALADTLPSLGGMLLSSLFWVLMAVGVGAAWWWLPAWMVLALIGGNSVLLGALGAFDDWKTQAVFRRVLRVLLRVLFPMLILGLASVAMATTLRGGTPSWLRMALPRLLAALPWLLPVAAGTLAAIMLFTLPRAFRRAVAAVHACRTEEDLERAK
jgi:hypothetical protein